MQDPNSRKSESQNAKQSPEPRSSTLWLRDESETPAAQTRNDVASALDDPVRLTANEDIQSAGAGASLAEEVGAPDGPRAVEAQDVQETQQTLVYADAEHLPDSARSADELAGDGSDVDTEEDRQDAVKSADTIARDESGFYAWPSAAFETPSIGRSILTPLLGIAALTGLLLAAWSYTALEEARAQLSSVTQDKASVDRSLADAQGRLAAAEKAVADVKSALDTPVDAAARKATTPKP